MSDVIVKLDFDRLACAFKGHRWNQNNHYHNLILDYLPLHKYDAIDIGCGTGDMARLLSNSFINVIGIDFSEKMIEKAEEQSRDYDNVRYICTDATKYEYEQNSADFIVSIAAFHHLEMSKMLSKLKTVLRPGGIFVLLDLYKPSNLMEYILFIAAFPINLIQELVRNKGNRQSNEEKKAWKQHVKNDTYDRIKHIKEIAKDVLPGAKVRHLFLWRYMLIWNKGQ